MSVAEVRHTVHLRLEQRVVIKVLGEDAARNFSALRQCCNRSDVSFLPTVWRQASKFAQQLSKQKREYCECNAPHLGGVRGYETVHRSLWYEKKKLHADEVRVALLKPTFPEQQHA